MGITYLGHSAFEIKIGDKKILIDPFFVKMPNYDYSNVTNIFLTHCHCGHLCYFRTCKLLCYKRCEC